MSKILSTCALAALAAITFAPGAFAQAIHLDLSAGQVTVLGSETLRINHLKAPGFPGTYRVDIQWDPNQYIFRPVGIAAEEPPPPTTPPPPPVDAILAKTELLKGHWHFVYTIISTFTDDYSLTTIPGTKNPQGGYFIHGTNQYGGPVVAAYVPTDANWVLLDPGTIIDQFYVFQTDGNSILSNSCYYLINPPGSTHFSRCYALTGVKTAALAAERAQKESGTRLHADEARGLELESINIESVATPVPPEIIERYLQMRGK